MGLMNQMKPEDLVNQENKVSREEMREKLKEKIKEKHNDRKSN